jgi:hypothetical protein
MTANLTPLTATPAVRAAVHLDRHNDRDAVADALPALPDVVQLLHRADTVSIYRSTTATFGGPTNPDRLAPREALHRQRLAHPEWTATDHVGWLTDNGYPLATVHGHATAEATVMQWLSEQQPTPLAQTSPPTVDKECGNG